MMGSPNCLMDQMCGGDLKYPNESYSPKHGTMYSDPRSKLKLYKQNNFRHKQRSNEHRIFQISSMSIKKNISLYILLFLFYPSLAIL